MKYYFIFLKSTYVYYQKEENKPFFSSAIMTGFVVFLHILAIIDVIGYLTDKVFFFAIHFHFIFLFVIGAANYYLLKNEELMDGIEISEKTTKILKHYRFFSMIILIIYRINFAPRFF